MAQAGGGQERTPEAARVEAAGARRLVDNSGGASVDADGRQVDRPEFPETRRTFRALAAAQMGLVTLPRQVLALCWTVRSSLCTPPHFPWTGSPWPAASAAGTTPGQRGVSVPGAGGDSGAQPPVCPTGGQEGRRVNPVSPTTPQGSAPTTCRRNIQDHGGGGNPVAVSSRSMRRPWVPPRRRERPRRCTRGPSRARPSHRLDRRHPRREDVASLVKNLRVVRADLAPPALGTT